MQTARSVQSTATNIIVNTSVTVLPTGSEIPESGGRNAVEFKDEIVICAVTVFALREKSIHPTCLYTTLCQ